MLVLRSQWDYWQASWPAEPPAPLRFDAADAFADEARFGVTVAATVAALLHPPVHRQRQAHPLSLNLISD